MKFRVASLGSWFIATVCVGSTFMPSTLADDSASLEFFESKVRPLLAEHCQKCHGPEKQKGGLRLDSREAILEGGDTGPAAVPGKAEASLIVEGVNYGEGLKMPPKSRLSKEDVETLTRWVSTGLAWPETKGPSFAKTKPGFDLQARKEAHWSWRAVRETPIPEVKDASWPRDPVDAFLLSRLEAKGIKPPPDAEKRALIRRANFDLIGLPPTPEEVDAFLADSDPQAFAKLIDRLLASPGYGERWARHWLDLVRYGETRGHEFDPAIPNAYQYRDYVIRALNLDVPYDKFVTEHIAGDLVREPRIDPTSGYNESILGTGFWFLGEEVHSPVDIRQDEADRFDNRIDVMSKTFLGLTVACARCHDHKFDAISQRDYYALTGFLGSSGYRQARFATDPAEKAVAEEFDKLNVEVSKRLAPLIASAVGPAVNGLDQSLLAAKHALNDPKAAVDPKIQAWSAELKRAGKEPPHPLHLFALAPSDPSHDFPSWIRSQFEADPSRWKTGGEPTATPAKLGRVIVDFRRPNAIAKLQDGYSFGLQTRTAGEVVLETASNGSPNLLVLAAPAARQEPSWLKVSNHARVALDHGHLGGWDRSGKTLRTPEFRIESGRIWYLVNGPGHSYAAVDSHLLVAGPLHRAILADWGGETSKWRWVSHDLTDYKGFRAHLELTSEGNEPLSVAMIVDSGTEPPPLFDLPNKTLDQALASSSAATPEALARSYRGLFKEAVDLLGSDRLRQSDDLSRIAAWIVANPALFLADETPELRILRDEVTRLAKAHEEIASKIPKAVPTGPAMFEGTGFDQALMIRGVAKNPGADVPRRFLEAIVGDAPIVDPTGGSGRLQLAEKIVHPTNPYISRVIVNRVWHHLFGKGIVASTDNLGVLGDPPTHPELLDFLAIRFMKQGWSVKTLIRELMLTHAYQMSSRPVLEADALDPNNLLCHRMPVKRLESEPIRDTILSVSGRLNKTMYGPSVPVHLTSFMDGRGRPGSSGPMDGDGRRGLYLEIRRNFLSPMMLAFDSPIPAGTIGRRNVSNVPAQALILMNDPFVVAQAGFWAERVLKETRACPEDRVASLYKTAFSRPPTPEETDLAVQFLQEQALEYRAPSDAWKNDPRAWADLCHVLINSKEFIFID